MDEERIVRLLERLGCDRIKKVGDEISCSCPFPENHRRGDRRPSFGVRINSEDSSPYNCFACGQHGALEGLAIKMGHADLVPDYKPRKVRRQTWEYKRPKNRERFRAKGEKRHFFQDVYLEPFAGVFSDYFKQRGITEETAKQWELGEDRRFKRAIFVMRDYRGRLAMVIGRDMMGDSNRAKYSNYVLDTVEKELIPYFPKERDKAEFVGPTKKFFLYGEHIMWGECKKEAALGRDLVVVEGPMDVLTLWQYGILVVGVLGSHMSSYQADKLVDMVPRRGRLVVMADGDKGGEIMTKSIVNEVKGRLPVYDAGLEPGYDPGDTPEKLIRLSIEKAVLI